jgi:RNA polymerase sigma-70 factor (ECF subfamily)
MTNSTLELVARWRDQGDHDAAAQLFQLYAARLIGLARRKLSGKLARRIDPEDVLQSVCRSFFVRVRDGRLQVTPAGDLWELLAAITMNKVLRQVEHYAAGKRSLDREQEPQGGESSVLESVEQVAREPGPHMVAALHDELAYLLQKFMPLHRQMVELHLEGYATKEIAAKVGRSERMVRNVLEQLRTKARERLE